MVCLVFLCITGVLVKAGLISAIPEESGIVLESLASGKTCTVTGTVYRIEKKETNQIIYLKQIQLQASKEGTNQIMLPAKACILYDKSFTEIPIGAAIKGKGKLKLFEGARNPGNFEQDFYYEKQGIVCSVFLNSSPEVRVTHTPYGMLSAWLAEVKNRWNQQLVEKAGKEAGGILAAILTGEKKGLDPQIKELYQKNGIGHILAISGLHVSFIGLGIYQLLRRFGFSFLMSGIFSTAILGLYMIMVGNSVSVVRAVWMLSVRIGADIAGRSYDLVTSLATAAAITAIWRPLYLKDASFLLSYGAILGILVMTPVMKMLYGGSRRLLDTFLGGLGLQLFLLPIMLYFYYEIPPYSILLNMIVIPFLTVLMGGAIAGSLFYLAGEFLKAIALFSAACEGMSHVCLFVCRLILQCYQLLGKWCMELPGSRIICGRPGMWQIVSYYSALLLLSVVAGKMKACGENKEKNEEKKRKNIQRRVKMTLFLAAAVAFCMTNFRKFDRNLEITLLDVGQGDCIYIRTPSGKHLLVDGGSTDLKQVGKYRIESFLLSRGVRALDYVMITHGDSDHYSGVEEMIERQVSGVEIERFMLPVVWRENEALSYLAAKALKKHIPVGEFQPGRGIVDGSCRLLCLQPGMEQSQWETNEASLVMQLSYGKFSMLLTGDVEGKGEELLCSSGKLSEITVLKTAHHGSEYSTSERFLRQTSPQLALISSGIDNAYGHPHPALLERLKSFRIPFYYTAESGALTVKTDGRTMTLTTFCN